MNNINLIYFRKILDKFPDIMGGYPTYRVLCLQ